MAIKPNTDHKQPKTVALQTYVLSLALTFVLTVMLGVIGGWFIAINVHEEARASVVHDIQLVKTDK